MKYKLGFGKESKEQLPLHLEYSSYPDRGFSVLFEDLFANEDGKPFLASYSLLNSLHIGYMSGTFPLKEKEQENWKFWLQANAITVLLLRHMPVYT